MSRTLTVNNLSFIRSSASMPALDFKRDLTLAETTTPGKTTLGRSVQQAASPKFSFINKVKSAFSRFFSSLIFRRKVEKAPINRVENSLALLRSEFEQKLAEKEATITSLQQAYDKNHDHISRSLRKILAVSDNLSDLQQRSEAKWLEIEARLEKLERYFSDSKSIGERATRPGSLETLSPMSSAESYGREGAIVPVHYDSHRAVADQRALQSGQEQLALIAGQEPLALTAGQEPLALTAGQEPLALTAGQRQLALTAGQEPLALTAGQGPLALTVGQRQLALTAGQRQLALTAGQEPLALTAGQGPLALTAGQRQLALTAGQRQLALTAGQRQLALTAGQRQLALTAGQRQLALTAGQRQLALTAGESLAEQVLGNPYDLLRRSAKQNNIAERLARKTLKEPLHRELSEYIKAGNIRKEQRLAKQALHSELLVSDKPVPY